MLLVHVNSTSIEALGHFSTRRLDIVQISFVPKFVGSFSKQYII